MAKDASLYLRKAIIARLRADAGITALVPAARIFTSVDPDAAKPFIRYGTAIKSPEQASCMDGSRVSVTIHAFSNAESDDEAVQIGAAIASALDGSDGKGLVLSLTAAPYPATARIFWAGGQTLPDAAEASAWHEVCNIEAVIAS